MTTPSVSVILATRNRSSVLGRAIQDVVSQTYSDFELIIVDSGTDNAKEVVQSFDDDRISYFWQEPQGLGAARNYGINKAKGDILMFQDDDDEWDPEKIAKQMGVFNQSSSEVGVVYTGVWKVTENGRHYVPGAETHPKEGDIHNSLLSHNFVSPQTAGVRKECFEDVGKFDESLPALEDWEMWLRLSQKFEFRYIDEALATAHITADSMSKDFEALSQARSMIVQKHNDKFDPKTRSRHLFWSGHGMMKTGRSTQGRRNIAKALLARFRPIYLMSFFLSLFGSTVYKRVYLLISGSDDV